MNALSIFGARPLNLWRRYQVWRAKRMYRRVVSIRVEAEMLMLEANQLMRDNAEPPPPGPLFEQPK